MAQSVKRYWQWYLSGFFVAVGLGLLWLGNIAQGQLPDPNYVSGCEQCRIYCNQQGLPNFTYGGTCHCWPGTPPPCGTNYAWDSCAYDCCNGKTYPKQGPVTVQFASSTYSVVEGQTATIVVNLNHANCGTVTVQYATSDGSPPNGAVAGTNYTTASGTLTFPVNPTTGLSATTASFTVVTMCSCLVDPPVTVNLTLSNPVGATLGSQATATLTIVDADSDLQTCND